jgi:hypothetical protein
MEYDARTLCPASAQRALTASQHAEVTSIQCTWLGMSQPGPPGPPALQLCCLTSSAVSLQNARRSLSPSSWSRSAAQHSPAAAQVPENAAHLKYRLIRSYPKLLDWLKAILLSSSSASSAEWRLLWKQAVITLLRQVMVGETVEMQCAAAGYLGVDVMQQLPQVQHCQPAFEEARALAALL